MDEHQQNCFAALMTAKTVSAISNILLVGCQARNVLDQVFKPTGTKYDFSDGTILHGNIHDDKRIVDEIILGCEGNDSFSLNCHGNPIIVENILELLKKHGAVIINAEDIISYTARKKFGDNIIAVEAEIAAQKAETLEGAKIIQHQMKMGLVQAAQWWLKHIDVMEIDDIRSAAEQIIADSKIASYFISGVKIVLAGPPNSGKSTLFNYLCGKEKAIVTDIAGTTRDWLSARIRLKKITAEFFDTAGLDDILKGKNVIDAQSQKLSLEMAAKADLILYVADASNPLEPIPNLVNYFNTLIVVNKCDLGNNVSADGVKISAKTGTGVKELIDEIEYALGVTEYDWKKTVCFTDRQREIIRRISSAQNKEQVKRSIIALLQGLN
ncbi:MAG: tRNA modification GTPase MnmE [Planctomycetes bacterium ADurb.Bin401]|nr:MAG: tRNA modification GTPase MnmE [Planctomycetes bacterium ADurb.Bin401]